MMAKISAKFKRGPSPATEAPKGRWGRDRQTDTHNETHTQTRVTNIHFASSTTHAKCNNELLESKTTTNAVFQ